MTKCHVWVGLQPQGYEARALCKLEAALADVDASCNILANFQLNGREYDAVVLKPDGIFLVEMKRVGGPVDGGINGSWMVSNGEQKIRLVGGNNDNPYQQINAQYHELTTWLEKYKQRFFSPSAAQTCRFRGGKQGEASSRIKIRSLLTLYPEVPKDSQIRVDWKVDVVGFEEMIRIVCHEGTRGVCLSDEEMGRIIELLGLEPWAASVNSQPIALPDLPGDAPSSEHSLASASALPAKLSALPIREQFAVWRQFTYMLFVQILIDWLTLHRQRVLTSLVPAPMHE